MPAIKSVTQSRSLPGGHAIEVDFQMADGSTHTLEIPFERIPHVMHAITSAAAISEARQKATPGDLSFGVAVPYRVQDMRAGSSPDGMIVADFATPQGPVQVAMTAAQTQTTIERLAAELQGLGRQQFPKLS